MTTEQAALLLLLQARDDMSPALKSAGGNLQDLEGKAKSSHAGLGALAGLVGSTLVGALSDAARAAAEEEVGIARLQQAVDNSGGSWEKQGAQIEDLIRRREQLGFSDDQLRESLATLVTTTGSVEEAQRRQALAMDLARGTGMDLNKASLLLGKTTDENVNTLKRYGITLEAGASAQDLFAKVQDRYGGQAEKYGATTAGALDRVRNAIGNFKEDIGGLLGPAQTLIALMPGMSAGFSMVSTATGALAGAGGLSGLGTSIGKLMGQLNPITLATRAWTLAQAALNLVMEANPIAIVVLAIIGLAAAVKFAYDHFEGFRNVVNTVMDFLGRLLAPLHFVIDALGALGRAVGIVPAEAHEMDYETSASAAHMATSVSSSTASMSNAAVSNAAAMQKGVGSYLDRMKDAGVGASEDMRIQTLLNAMGMKESVVREAENMASGMGHWSEQAADRAIFDMQYAELETTLRAKGLADGVIAEILRMASRSREEFENARAASVTNVAIMHDNMAGYKDVVSRTAQDVSLLRQNIESLPTDRRITITTAYAYIGSPGGPAITAQHGYEGMVGPSYGGARMFLAGEGGGDEHVSIRPVGARPAGSGGGGGLTVIVQGNLIGLGPEDLARRLGKVTQIEAIRAGMPLR